MPVTKYIYDFEKVLQETDGSNAVQNEYTSTTELYGDLLSAFDGSSTKYCEPDALGSTDALINEAQAQTDKWKYRAFGAATHTQGATATPFTFVGRQGYYWDSETSLYLMGSGTRYYDPQVAQFLSKDPIGITAGDANDRKYAGNNPVSMVDPSGRQPPAIMSKDLIWSSQKITELDSVSTSTPFADMAAFARARIKERVEAKDTASGILPLPPLFGNTGLYQTVNRHVDRSQPAKNTVAIRGAYLFFYSWIVCDPDDRLGLKFTEVERVREKGEDFKMNEIKRTDVKVGNSWTIAKLKHPIGLNGEFNKIVVFVDSPTLGARTRGDTVTDPVIPIARETRQFVELYDKKSGQTLSHQFMIFEDRIWIGQSGYYIIGRIADNLVESDPALGALIRLVYGDRGPPVLMGGVGPVRTPLTLTGEKDPNR
jgi:RHS repeat-associated protein